MYFVYWIVGNKRERERTCGIQKSNFFINITSEEKVLESKEF